MGRGDAVKKLFKVMSEPLEADVPLLKPQPAVNAVIVLTRIEI